MSTDFDIPEDLEEEARAAANAVLSVLPKNPSGGGCRAFYSPAEWFSRGERYGTESVLVLVHDGGDLAPYCNWDYGDSEAVEKLQEALKPLGLFVESCTCWYSAVYRG